MAMADLDRQRASHLMSQAGIDGLILFKKKLGDLELIDASEVLAKLKVVKLHILQGVGVYTYFGVEVLRGSRRFVSTRS